MVFTKRFYIRAIVALVLVFALSGVGQVWGQDVPEDPSSDTLRLAAAPSRLFLFGTQRSKQLSRDGLIFRNYFVRREADQDLFRMCIFEVLQAVGGPPSDPDAVIYDAQTKLPDPWIVPGNDDSWKAKYQRRTGRVPIVDNPGVKGHLGSTWDSPPAATIQCDTVPKSVDTVEESAKGWKDVKDATVTVNGLSQKRHLGSFLDQHGVLPASGKAPVEPRAPYPIGPGWNLRQYYMWYNPSNPSRVYTLGGPFYIRRWVWYRVEKQFDQLFDTYVMYENVRKYRSDMTPIENGEQQIGPPIGASLVPPKVER